MTIGFVLFVVLSFLYGIVQVASTRNLLGNRHHVKGRLGLEEDLVHLFEMAAVGLRKEEVHHWTTWVSKGKGGKMEKGAKLSPGRIRAKLRTAYTMK
jgi:hypothetical protein